MRSGATEQQWKRWLSMAHEGHAAPQLAATLTADLTARSGQSYEAAEIERLQAFIVEYARSGREWQAAGLRGDQVVASLDFLARSDLELFEALLEKVAQAEYLRWLGGSVDPQTAARRRAYTRFVIASASRSGTHLLRTLLDSHPCVEMQGESFNTLGLSLLPYGLETSVDTILERHIFRPYFEYVEAVGFVLFRNLDALWAGENVWDKLASLTDLKIVHLERSNHVARLVSLKRSLSDKVWYVGTADERSCSEQKIVITPDELFADIELHERTRSRFLERFQAHEILRLTYEDLAENTEAVVGRCMQFLNLHPCRLIAGTRKKETRRLQDVIANFDELQRQLDGGPYAKLLGR